MPLVEVHWKPSDRQLRQFGLIALVGLPLAGWLFGGKPWPSEASDTQKIVIGSLAGLGVVLAILAFVRPQALRWPFIAATLFTLPIGLVVGELILAIIYFALFLPVALVFRLMGRDALDRGIDRSAKSYWQPKTQPTGPESYFRQS